MSDTPDLGSIKVGFEVGIGESIKALSAFNTALTATIEQAVQGTAKLTSTFSALNAAAAASVSGVATASKSAEKGLGELESAGTKTKKSLENIVPPEAINRFGRLKESVESLRGSLESIFTLLAATGGEQLTEIGAAFDKAMSGVRLITRDTAQDMRGLRAEIVNLAAATSTSAEKVIEVFTDVRRGAKSNEEAFQIVDAAIKGGKVTMTDATVVAQTLERVLLSFNVPASNAADVMGKLAMATQIGKLNMAQLGGVLGSITPAAVAAGVSLEELLAIMTSLSKQGVAMEESGLQLRTIFTALAAAASGNKAAIESVLGSTVQASVANVGFVATLKQLLDAAGGSNEGLKEFGATARSLPLLSRLASDGVQTLNKDMETLRKAGVASLTEGLGIVGDSLGSVLKRMKELVAIQLVKFFENNRDRILGTANAMYQFAKAHQDVLYALTATSATIATVSLALVGLGAAIKLVEVAVGGLKVASAALAYVASGELLASIKGAVAGFIAWAAAANQASGATALVGSASALASGRVRGGLLAGLKDTWDAFKNFVGIGPTVATTFAGVMGGIRGLVAAIPALAATIGTALATIGTLVLTVTAVAAAFAAAAYGAYKLGKAIAEYVLGYDSVEGELEDYRTALKEAAKAEKELNDQQRGEGAATQAKKLEELTRLRKEYAIAVVEAAGGEEEALARMGDLNKQIQSLSKESTGIDLVRQRVADLTATVAKGADEVRKQGHLDANATVPVFEALVVGLKKSAVEASSMRKELDTLTGVLKAYDETSIQAESDQLKLGESVAHTAKLIGAAAGVVGTLKDEVEGLEKKLKGDGLTEYEKKAADAAEQLQKVQTLQGKIAAQINTLGGITPRNDRQREDIERQQKVLADQAAKMVQLATDAQAQITKVEEDEAAKRAKINADLADATQADIVARLRLEEKFAEAERIEATKRYEKRVTEINATKYAETEAQDKALAAAKARYDAELNAVEKLAKQEYERTEQGRKEKEKADQEQRRREKLTEAAILKQQLLQAQANGAVREEKVIRERITQLINESTDLQAKEADLEEKTLAKARERADLLKEEIRDRIRAGQSQGDVTGGIREAESDIIGSSSVGGFRRAARSRFGEVSSEKGVNDLTTLVTKALEAEYNSLAAERANAKDDAERAQIDKQLREVIIKFQILTEEASKAISEIAAQAKARPVNAATAPAAGDKRTPAQVRAEADARGFVRTDEFERYQQGESAGGTTTAPAVAAGGAAKGGGSNIGGVVNSAVASATNAAANLTDALDVLGDVVRVGFNTMALKFAEVTKRLNANTLAVEAASDSVLTTRIEGRDI